KRRILDERHAPARRHQPVAVIEDVLDETEGVRLVGLPRIVADEPERGPRREQRDARQSLHAGCATTLRNSPSSLSASVSFSSSFCAQASSAARCLRRMPSAFSYARSTIPRTATSISRAVSSLYSRWPCGSGPPRKGARSSS